MCTNDATKIKKREIYWETVYFEGKLLNIYKINIYRTSLAPTERKLTGDCENGVYWKMFYWTDDITITKNVMECNKNGKYVKSMSSSTALLWQISSVTER